MIFDSKEIHLSLLPWFVTGFTDAEGYFKIRIKKSKSHRLGWAVQLVFLISALNNSANRVFLESLVLFFGGGQIYLDRNQLYYCVQDLSILLKVRDHFLLYPLQSTKWIYFQLWSLVLDMMVAKEHLTLEGLLRIVAIRSHFPKGLSKLLSNAFPSLPFVFKPNFIPSPEPLNSYRIVGFANGDGSFSLGYTKRSDLR
jgi:hypothetical protein